MKAKKEIIMKNWQQGIYLYGMVCSIQFFFLSFIAMLFYPGGYSFFTDPLSKLGFTHISDESNFISSIVFNLSMFLLGTSIIVLFPTMLTFFTKNYIERYLGIAASIFSFFSGLAMCGAAFTPGDINYEAHVAFAPFTFLFSVFMILLISITIYMNDQFPNSYSVISIAYVFLVIINLVLMVIGPSYDTDEGLIMQTSLQKIIIYAEVILLFSLSYGAWKLRRRLDILSPIGEDLDT